VFPGYQDHAAFDETLQLAHVFPATASPWSSQSVRTRSRQVFVVITAQSAALADEVTAVNILGRRMANTVLLIQALGGGWDRSTLPERPECCGKLASNTK
jgi:hypothetical protein